MSNEDANSICIGSATISGFLDTDYVIQEQDITLNIGCHNDQWSRWCNEHRWETFGLITAYNPWGTLRSDEQNLVAENALSVLLREEFSICLTTLHKDKMGLWPVEKGFVLNGRLDRFIELANKFGQAGFVFGRDQGVPLLYLDSDRVDRSAFTEFSFHPHIRFY